MTVQELMTNVDVNRVADAYLLLDYYFSDDNFEQTLRQKYEAVPCLRHILRENIYLFKNVEVNTKREPHTIFIMEVSTEDYDESWKKKLEGFSIADNDVIPVINKDFRLFDDDGDQRINHYCFDMTPLEDLAGYTIAQSAIEILGSEICAAYIMSVVFRFGLTPIERENNISDLYKQLDESIKSVEEGNLISHEELMEALEIDLFSKSTEDERTYWTAEKVFKEATESIRNKHLKQVYADRHQQYIDEIRREFSNRVDETKETK